MRAKEKKSPHMRRHDPRRDFDEISDVPHPLPIAPAWARLRIFVDK